MSLFLGFDHIDCRVRSLAAVESFYDEVLAAIGLTEKRYAFVDADREWHRIADTYNAVEYYEPDDGVHPRRFIGFIEDPLHRINETRIAFRVPLATLDELHEFLTRVGAPAIERSNEPDYQAIFFEDPTGTKLEFIGR